MEGKLRKVRIRSKEDEKKYADQHEQVVDIEERCRSMNEIVKFKQSEEKKGLKTLITMDDIQELESQYEAMIFEKEEN